MNELHCTTCGHKLTSALAAFGDIGQEMCWGCFIASLDAPDAVDDDEYERSVRLGEIVDILPIVGIPEESGSPRLL